jgi:hypothetical protein
MCRVHQHAEQCLSSKIPQGFFFIPIHRLLGIFLARTVVRDCIAHPLFLPAGEVAENQPNIFYQALKKHIPDPIQLA